MPLKEISKIRFDALAGNYARDSLITYITTEIKWLQTTNADFLITVLLDHTDRDFNVIILAKDLQERYRCVDCIANQDTLENALSQVEKYIENNKNNFEQLREQGDETDKPVDFFAPIAAPEKLHTSFKKLTQDEQFSPAYEIIKPMMRWFEDADGNFIEQFQSSGFDARLWELAIFATLREAGYTLSKEYPTPDFITDRFCIEATTVNPSYDNLRNLIAPPPCNTPDEKLFYVREYLPYKLSIPLTAKLKKKYWGKKHVANKPFVMAIQDFHSDNTMSMLINALPTYLYGKIWGHHYDDIGNLIVTPEEIRRHTYNAKTAKSNFFNLPNSEYVSAVISNPSATISKFNRMGAIAKFGSPRVKMKRVGTIYDPNPNASSPIPFIADIPSPEYNEKWIEGLHVYHNPNAKLPLDCQFLPNAIHHFLQEDGQLAAYIPRKGQDIIESQTFIFLDN